MDTILQAAVYWGFAFGLYVVLQSIIWLLWKATRGSKKAQDEQFNADCDYMVRQGGPDLRDLL